MPSDVFISHSSADKAVADKICEYLEARNISCWIAPRNILPGEEWGDSILRGINNCRIMVLVFSKAANDSGPVRSEIDRAANGRKEIIPFRIENVAPTGAMEFHIGRRHWLEAYKPPLEKHLDLLARTCQQQLTPIEEAAPPVPPSTGSTIMADSTAALPTMRRPETVSLPKVVHEEVPMRVLLNFNHVVVAGHPSTFEMIVENVCPETMNQIEIVMESRGLERAAMKKVQRLAPTHSQRHVFEIEPIRSGNFALQCTIKCQQEMKQIAMVGSRSLRINEAPSTSNVVVGMKDMRGNSVENPTAGGSQLAGMISAGSVRTLNDLLDLELEENFEPLDLTLDYEVSMRALAVEAGGRQRLNIPGSFLGQGQEGVVLKLEPVAAAVGTAALEFRLVARSSFSLGRSREEADFLTWFWPRSEANDQKTRRISKKQCVLTVQGSRIYVRNASTTSPTAFGGVNLTGNEGEPLERRGILRLADVYSIDVTPFPSNALEGPTIANLRDWAGPKKEDVTPVRGCVRFLPMSTSVMPQYATWLLTDGAFGTSRANPIIVDLRGLAEIQGRFHHHAGGFWIETSVSNGGVHVNGARLEPGFIIPLVTGQTLRLGDGSFRVTVST